MKSLGKSLLRTALALCFISNQANAAAITLFNTGVDGAGTPLPNGPASIDSHYVISINPDAPPADGTTHVQDETAFPIVAGPWVPNSGTAKWIGPRFDTTGSAAGTYEYTTTFSLPADAIPVTATITGLWAFDDPSGAGGIFLNGTLVAPANTAGFTSLTAFTIPQGSPFVAGANTLSFQGANGGGWTGLMVDRLAGTVDIVPEPGAFTLLGFVTVGIAARRRRR